VRIRLAALVLLAATSCADEQKVVVSQAPTREAKPTPTMTKTPEPDPKFRVLEHIGYSMDDALENCFPFDGDGRRGDPDGLDGKLALELAYGKIETKILADGREVLCTMLDGTVGAKGCEFEGGHWLHRLVKADGTTLKLPNDVRFYRIHHGEIDAWLWQSYEHSLPYDFIGTNFAEFCSDDQ
jgi:hypothetical protein